MKKHFITILIACMILTISCNKEKPLNVDITKSNTDSYAAGEIDQWLTTNFLDPYNIEVLYRFDRFQAEIDKDLAPVLESQIKPVMETVRDIWLEPYLQIAGKNFIKPLAPKQIVLVGSAEYNIDGSITLGTADAGRRINLFVLNSFNKLNSVGVEQMLHTIHHEFAHILHQNIPVPPDYETISPEYVGGSWLSFTNTAQAAKNLGFITRYSRLNKDEDFVEIVSFLLVEGQERFDAYVNTAPPTGAARLRQKEQIVVDYYKSSYNIDFRELQQKVKKSYETVTNRIIPFRTNFIAGSYTIFNVNKNATGQSAAFVAAYNQTQANVFAFNTTNRFSVENSFVLEFTNVQINRTNITLKIKGSNASGVFNGSFWYNFNVSVNAATGATKFTLAATQPAGVEYNNGTAFAAAFKPLLDYLTITNFRADWVDTIVPDSRGKLGGFYNTATNNIGFYASLNN